MQLSRVVPSHRKTVKFHWCKSDFMVMSQKYREIRSKLRSPMDSCFWCGHKFSDGEMMALANPEHGTNVVLCQICASELNNQKAEGE